MPTSASVLDFVAEVPTATTGDTVTNPNAGSLTLFNNGGVWYSKSSAGVVTALAGLTALTTGTGTDAFLRAQVSGTTVTLTSGRLGSIITGGAKVYAAADRGKLILRSNGAAAMGDTLPTTLNDTTDIGWELEVFNEDTVPIVYASATFRSSAGVSAAGTYTQRPATRQTFRWQGSTLGWMFGTGNANLLRGPSSSVAGHIPTFTDTYGLLMQDSGSSIGTGASIASGSTVSGSNTGDQTITLTGDVTGAGTGSFAATIAAAAVTNTKLANMADSTVKGRAVGAGTGVPTDLTTAQLTALVNPATSSLSGALSSTDKNHLANFFGNGWFNVQDYGVLPGNTAAANVTAMNTLLGTTAPANSVIYFPPGTYQFGAALTTLTKDFSFVGVRGFSSIAITANIAGNFLTFLNTGFYSSVIGLAFICFAAQTTGYLLEFQNNANVLVQDCFFVGSGANLWSGVIDFTGTNSGNGAVLRSVYIAGFNGTAINVASPLDTMYIQDLEIVNNAGGGSSIGINFTDGGAAVMVDCQIIQCNVNIQIAPANTKTVSSVFASNCFFDQGRTNSLLITGAGTALRNHFTGCWFTLSSTAGAGAAAVAINTSGASIHGGALFTGCHVLNTPTSSGSAYGFLVAANSDLTIEGCQIAGWQNTAISITPAAGSVTALNIGNNIIGASGGVGTNGVGIALGAGNYASVVVQGNTMGGNTTPLTDASTTTLSSNKIISGNTGLSVAPGAITATTAAISTTETYVTKALALPANSLLVGTTYRATLVGTCTSTAANISTFTVRVGTTGTTPASDTTATAALATTAGATTGTAVPFTVQVLITVRAIGASTLLECGMTVINTGVTGIMSVATGGAVAATGTFNNNTALFLNISYKSAAATTTSTFQLAAWEVLAQ